MPDNITDYLTDFVQAHLPTARAMQVEVAGYDHHTLTLTAPLEFSHNDKYTAFGGSLYVVAVMACWGMVYLRCRERGIDPDIVVAKGEIDYRAPVNCDILARSVPAEEESWDAFFTAFAERGRGKIELRSQVLVGGEPAVEFKGVYAIVGQK